MRKEVRLVIKLMSINTFTTCSILICNITSLHHKILNYPMENISFVPQLLSFFTSTNCSKVLDGLWNLIFEELKYHSTFDILTSIFSLSYIYIEKYFGICFFIRRQFVMLRHNFFILINSSVKEIFHHTLFFF